MFFKYKRPSSYCLSFLIFFTGLVHAQINTEKHNIDTSYQTGFWIVTVDFENDGDPDIVAASINSGLRWYENDGSGSFSQHVISSTFNDSWSIHPNDIDSDGDMDVVACAEVPKNISWFRNNGDGTFTERLVEENYQIAHGVFSADLDNDNDIDLMAAVWENRNIVWWENNGEQNFTRHVLDNDFNSPHAIRAIDLDEDGDQDIIAGGGGKTAWWRNDGAGAFSRTSLGSFGTFSVLPTDLDQDGDLDILRNQRNNGDIDWFENDGGTFSERSIAPAIGESWSQVVGDLDLDGDNDVVVAEYVPDQITYWLNDGNESFSRVLLDDSVTRPRCVNLADYDGDGDKDIGAVLTKNKRIVWYEILGSPPQPNTLTVTSPNGGETLEAGATFPIQWTHTGDIADVLIEYSADSGSNWTTVVTSTPNDSTFDWLLPNIESQTMLVRVSDALDAATSDTSDAVFSVSISSLTITSPNGGESLPGVSTQDITWTSTGPISNVRLEYSPDNGASWTEIVASTPNSGSYSWSVPDFQTSLALIRVSDAADGVPSDESDAPFAIVASVLTLTSPNGGENWQAGTLQTIAWTSSGNIGPVKAEYWTQANGWLVIIESMENDGSYDWTVPDISDDSVFVRISDAGDGVPSDVSDADFTISQPSLTLTSPNGGEIWSPATTQNITWNSAGDISAVKLEYSVNAGGTWLAISASAPNSGTFAWLIPPVQTTVAMVRISDAADENPADVSDNTFSIRDPELALLAPNGGELWNGGTSQTISWQTIGTVPFVDLEYSTNSGANWSLIADDLANTDSLQWSVPNLTSNTVLVRITSSSDPTLSDESDAVFIIIRSGFTILSPNGGEIWEAETVQQVSWNSNGDIAAVNLYYSVAPDSPRVAIAQDIPNSGSYTWTLPDITSDQVSLFIENAADAAVNDVTDAVFAILRRGITVTSPNGGETWAGGSTQTIAWLSVGSIDSVLIEYSLNKGNTWVRAGRLENSGGFLLLVPNVLTVNALVRVASTADSEVEDESDAVFTIISSSLNLLVPNGGELWLSGSTQEVRWQSSGLLQSVRLEYSADNGRLWEVIDPEAPNSGSYDWTLPDISSDSVLVRINSAISNLPSDVSDARFTISPTVSVADPRDNGAVPTDFALAQNYPNPFNLGTRIDFSLATSSNVVLRLYDLRGRLVQTLHNGRLAAGQYSITWDGKNKNGSVATSGVYVYTIEAGDWRAARRLVLVK